MVSIFRGITASSLSKSRIYHRSSKPLYQPRRQFLPVFIVSQLLLVFYYILLPTIMTPSSATTAAAAVKRRAMKAIKGAFIADAASMGTHWTYDPAEMLKLVTDKATPEFRDPTAPQVSIFHYVTKLV